MTIACEDLDDCEEALYAAAAELKSEAVRRCHEYFSCSCNICQAFRCAHKAHGLLIAERTCVVKEPA